jgi:hypothetical protein
LVEIRPLGLDFRSAMSLTALLIEAQAGWVL